MAVQEAEELFEVTCLNENDEDNEICYNCSACKVNFSNVDEHLKLFHQQEEIVTDEVTNVMEIVDEHDIIERSEEFDGMAFVIKNSEGKFECKECFRTFQSVKRFITHVKTHNSVPEEEIQQLEEYIKQLENEDLFEEIETKSGQKNFRCKECNTIFTTKKRFRLHYPIHTNVEAALKRRTHIDTEDDFLYCELCNRSLKNAHELEMHMNGHAENSAHGSKSKSVLEKSKDELQKKKKKGEASYPCQYCQKDFKRPHEKVKHERIHTGEKPYSCELCGKRFRVTYCLSLHKRNVHSDERPYVCSFEGCNKRFKSQSVYNHHLNTHGEEKNYKCPFCSKAFKTGVQLAGHKNTHTKPFSCQVCSRAFASLYALKIHVNIHDKSDANDLKYTCKICSAQYGRSFALSDHIKTVHGEVADEGIEDNEEHYIIEESQVETAEEENGEVYSVLMVPDDQ